MILEADRMLSAWFADETSGVNAMLAALPLDGDDPRPEPLALITSEMDDDEAAVYQPPATLPALSVSTDHVADLDGTVVTVERDGQAKLRIRITVDNTSPAAAKRDLSYYLRATLRSFKAFLTNDQNAARTKNGIYLEHCESMDVAIDMPKDATNVTQFSGYILPTLRLRDLAP